MVLALAALVGLGAKVELAPRALEQRANLRVAVNQVFAEPDTLIRAGDEVAVFPPVTGG